MSSFSRWIKDAIKAPITEPLDYPRIRMRVYERLASSNTSTNVIISLGRGLSNTRVDAYYPHTGLEATTFYVSGVDEDRIVDEIVRLIEENA